MTRFYLVRHGATDYNGLGVYFGKTDCPLNVEGILQGKALGEALSDIRFNEIYASPLKRCLDTVRFITTDKKPVVLEGLMELDFGLWEGLDYKSCMELFPEEFRRWSEDYRNEAPPEGEIYTDFFRRIRDIWSSQLSRSEGTVLIVAHKGVLQLLTSIMLKGDDSLFWNFNFQLGRYSILEIEGNHGTLTRLNV
jgi:alpha-ribazole phosphatase